ncbi:aconitate hydratase AcnA [Candidatus Nitrosacidococcus tergens]|uniref:Aconitate hydratase n=1 Tax=Candidatus Nitrosacidococcus tergens TaxID=553981 RepID=A0A7G1Q9A7_9GAMM|nr:aconitate hydratase AcnA [Candidatus Nitrosacidococcus tergens]CAB1275621.1 Aconitate hydratase [Candidatus Nitrosacidococcus tergens]
MSNSFDTQSFLKVGDKSYRIFSLNPLKQQGYDIDRFPYTLKILLENLLRTEDGINTTQSNIEALLNWNPKVESNTEVCFTPARVLMQDFTGVPAVVDLAAMRDAMKSLGGNPNRINPLSPVDLVIDHSVMVDYFGNQSALIQNIEKEYARNQERYEFLRWGQYAFSNFRVVPPGTGIIHQVNLEYLATIVFTHNKDGIFQAYPDSLVGTDSHTTMINGLGVLGWGVGGIEAEAAMLGQPLSLLIPQVIGIKLSGKIPEGSTATDLVLTITELLRRKGVVGRFVEFFGNGLNNLSLADRATISNMAPEYGATCSVFPIDYETINYLKLTGRPNETIALVESYAQEQGLWYQEGKRPADYTEIIELDMGSIEPCVAGPKRPQDRVSIKNTKVAFPSATLDKPREGKVLLHGESISLKDGAIVIAAITSCTNTSNPDLLIAAGLLAKKAYDLGLKAQPWVKTSFAPGSQVVPAYLEEAGLMEFFNKLGFNIVGFGCTTCIGNSGPLPEIISKAIKDNQLTVASILSGNRNFEGRIHAEIQTNWLTSPPLVIAYALAGYITIDLTSEPLGKDRRGHDVYLKDIWPTRQEIIQVTQLSVKNTLFHQEYSNVFKGADRWQQIKIAEDKNYHWNPSSYIAHPPYFEHMGMEVPDISRVVDARCLVMVGNSVTTDHISPAGSIPVNSPAGQYLLHQGVTPEEFNSYGARRGNHHVMIRGTFANVRLKNQLAPNTEGGWTTYIPSNQVMSIFDAAEKYCAEKVPLIVIAGKEYGTGSSRDWAAKGVYLLGIKAVIAESFERIHRSNLVGFGVLPLQFESGENAAALGLTGKEKFSIAIPTKESKTVKVTVFDDIQNKEITFNTLVRIDTPKEWDYFRNGGILHYVLRNLATDS